MVRDPKTLLVGAALLLGACAAEPTAVVETPAAHVTPSPRPSPSPVVPLAITSVAFHAGELSLNYTPVTPKAKGGEPPYAWSISGGSLPGGLLMSAAGTVTGVPQVLGTFLFSVQVADSVGATASISSSITVTRRVAVTGNPCTPASPCNVEAGCVTQCGLFGFLSGGVGPYKYRVTSGSIPTGMVLSGFSLTRAFPAPALAAGKDWVFTVQVTDAIGATAATTTKFHVYPHIAFVAPLSVPCTGGLTAGVCTATLHYKLGTPNLPSPKVTVSPSLPSGSSYTALNGTVTVTVKCSGYSGNVKVTLADQSTCGPNLYCTSGPATVVVPKTC